MPSIIGTTIDIPAASLAVANGPLFDYYPYDEGVPAALHWRLGDFKRTLLDLTIRPDGAIVGVTLTIFAGRRLHEAPRAFEAAKRVQGAPIVDRAAFESSRLDERTDLSLHVGLDRAFLLLEHQIEGSICMTIDRVGFYVADRRLVGIGFCQLLANEREEVLQILDDPRLKSQE
jgi:hypothetical protein